MKDLAKANLIACVAAMAPRPGWEVLREEGLVALKAPSRHPLANFAWGPVSERNLELCRAFYGPMPYSWLLAPGQDPAGLAELGFWAADPCPEMVCDLARAEPLEPVEGVRVVRADREHLVHWEALVGEGFRIPGPDVREFFLPLIEQGGCVPYLAYHRDRPAATALTFRSQGTLGIYAVATGRAHRRLGLGQAVIGACVEEGREAGMAFATLYSSVMGWPFYERIGFHTEQVLKEFCTANHPSCI